MKTICRTTAALLLTLPLSAACFAEEAQKPAEPAQITAPGPGMGKGPGMGHGMGGMSEEQQDERLKAMQEHQLVVHDLSNKILAEQDPAKKEQLKKEQRDLMKAHRQQMMMQMMNARQNQMQKQGDMKPKAPVAPKAPKAK